MPPGVSNSVAVEGFGRRHRDRAFGECRDCGMDGEVEARRRVIDSVAVLPFVDSGGDPNLEYLSDGITESLIDNLSQVPNLRVAARSAVFRYKSSDSQGHDLDPQKIGRDLQVGAVLSGRLTRRRRNAERSRRVDERR